MALVGEAHILVKAITTGVADDIKRGLNSGSVRSAASAAGRSVGNSLSRALSRSGGKGDGIFGNISNAFKKLQVQGKANSATLRSMMQGFYFAAPAVTTLLGTIGGLVGGLVSLGSAVLGAAVPALVSFVGAIGAVGAAMIVMKVALGGVSQAIQKYLNQKKSGADKEKEIEEARKRYALAHEQALERLVDANKRVERAQSAYNDAIREGAEELQQLSFDAEDAALAEKKAAIELEKARETLIRTQDLPPNSRARKEAELAFQEADLNLRRAKDKVVDLNKEQNRIANQGNITDQEISALEEISEANKNLAKTERDNARSLLEAKEALDEAGKSAKAASDPFEGLTKSQKEFALLIIGLIPKYRELKETIADGFLPELGRQILELDKVYYPILSGRLGDIASETANATGKIKDKLLDPVTVKAFDDALAKLGAPEGPISKIGSIAGTTAQILIELFDASIPYADDFLAKIDEVATDLRDWLRETREDGSFDTFMTNATTALDTIGTILGNTLGGIGTLISANIGPGSGGQNLLDWIAEATEGFKNLTPSESQELKDLFYDLSETFKSIVGFAGDLAGILLDLAVNPGTKEFFDVLRRDAVPVLKELAEKIQDGAADLADFLVLVLEFLNAFVTAEGPKVFFDTLNSAIKPIVEFFKSDFAQDIIKVVAPIAAFISAILLLAQGFVFAFSIAVYWIGLVFGLVQKVFQFLGLIVRGITLLFGVSTPVGWIILIVAALVGFFTYFFTSTEMGKEMWANMVQFFTDVWNNMVAFVTEVFNEFSVWIGGVVTSIGDFFNTVFSAVGQFFQDTWNGVVAFFQPLIDGIVAYFTAAFDIIRGVVEVLAAIFTIIFIGIGWVVQMTFDGIKAAWQAVVDWFSPILDTVFGFFEDVFQNIGNFIAEIWQGIEDAWQAVVDWFTPILDEVFGFFEDVFQNIGNFIGGVWRGIEDGFKKFIEFIKPAIDGIFGFFNTVFTNIRDFFKRMINQYIGFAEGFVNFFIKGLNWIIENINKLKIKVPDILKDLFGGQTEIGFNIARVTELKLPRLAKGGVVQPSVGGTMAVLAEAGRPERIEPLDPDGLSNRDKTLISKLVGNGNAGNINITVNPSEGMDEREIAAIVSREIALQLRKGSLT
jgi:phage-related protein